MNKLGVVGVSLPVTSAILVYNFAFVTTVEARENSLSNFASSHSLTQFNLSDRHKINLEHFQVIADKSTPITLKPAQNYQVVTPTQLTNNSHNFATKDIPTTLIGNSLQINNHISFSEGDRSNLITTESAIPDNNLEPFIPSTRTPIDNSINQTLTQIEEYKLPGFAIESLPKVSNLKDIEPTDWEYQTLISLNEEYDCLDISPNNNFRDNLTVTRNEFATGLNSCLQAWSKLNQGKLTNTKEFAELERLKTEFNSELLTVQTAADELEQRVAILEERNFSPTTILRGQVDFIFASAVGDNKAVPSGETPSEDLADEVTFSGRAQLNFETSFTGKDLLRTRIEAGNINAFGSGVTGTQMTFLGTSTNTDNTFRIGQLFYRFPLGEKGNGYIAGARQSASAFVPTLNRASTISLFGFNNPLYDLGFGAGGGVYYQFTDSIGAGATYYSGSPSSTEEGRGFFNGDYSALGQITYTPTDSVGISFTYAHFFSPEPGATNNVTGFTGSQFAQLPFGESTATASDNFNLAFSYQLNERIELGGWLGYINANAQSSPADSGFADLEDADADIWTSALTFSYSDLGELGSKLSFIIGLPPKLTSNDLQEREDDDTSLHLEVSYNYPLTEKIFLKPGVLAITDPEHNSENDSIVIGLLQTTFTF